MLVERERPRVPADDTIDAPSIARAGHNCWRIEPAARFRCIQDGADYFALVHRALLDARETVFILGWDISATIDLLPGAAAGRAPTSLGRLLRHIARRRRSLRIYVLVWEFGSVYALERDPFTRLRFTWGMPRNVRFAFDGRHPVGGSHHQKVVVIDDALAFAGGIDLTGHRWDTCEHRVEHPHRLNAMGRPYTPYHEVHAMMDGPAAAALGALARDRWRALGADRLPAVRAGSADLWPDGTPVDLQNARVIISRTMPPANGDPAVRECEALYFDSIAAAKRTIYIESQYFTNDRIREALSKRLAEPDGPEVIVVMPDECHGWLEQQTVGVFRNRVCRALVASDTHKRLRLVYPIASQAAGVPTFVHSKVMIVDDSMVRIGSANCSNRSMGVDTECDVAVEALGDRRLAQGIQRIRDRLVGEHLGLPPDDVARCVERQGSLRAAIDSCRGADRCLVRVTIPNDDTGVAEALRSVADPEEPIGFGPAIAQVLPPVEAATRPGPLRIWILPLTALVSAGAVALWRSSGAAARSDWQAPRDWLAAAPSMDLVVPAGIAVFAAAAALLMPIEFLAVAAGALLGPLTGGIVAFGGSIVAALVGYGLGRAVGPAALPRWMSARAYRLRSRRQLRAGSDGRRGDAPADARTQALHVAMTRLADSASAGSFSLWAGAHRLALIPFVIGTAIGSLPVVAGLVTLGALVRWTLLESSLERALIAIVGAVAIAGVAAVVRILLLMRQFAPAVSGHRRRTEFG